MVASQPLISDYLFILRDASEKVGVSLNGLLDVIWSTVNDICDIKRGKRLIKSELRADGKYPVYQNSMVPLGFYNAYNFSADNTFIISAGAAGEINYMNSNFWAADDVYVLVTSETLQSKFLYHFLIAKQNTILSKVRRASVPRLPRTAFENIKLPIPTISEQTRIVKILDVLNILISDLVKELPREIQLRQKQYEHHREQLLNFQR